MKLGGETDWSSTDGDVGVCDMCQRREIMVYQINSFLSFCDDCLVEKIKPSPIV